MLTPPQLDKFFTDLQTFFWLALHNAEVWSPRVARTYPTKTSQVLHGWIGMFDRPRVWNGSRVVRQPAPQTYAVPIVPFELTESIDQFVLDDDQYGIYFPTAQRMGQEYAKTEDYAIRDMLQGVGDFAGNPWQQGADGAPQWGTHNVNYWDASMGTYVNDYGTAGVVVNGVTVGGLLSTNAFRTVWEDMSARLNESGEAIGVKPDTTMYPSQLKFTMDLLLKSQMFAPPVFGNLGTGATGTANAPFVGATNNPLMGATEGLWIPDLNGQPTAWYMMESNNPVKPLGWALRQSPVFVIVNSPTSPSVFDSHTYLYGVWERAAPHWGLPWQISRSGID